MRSSHNTFVHPHRSLGLCRAPPKDDTWILCGRCCLAVMCFREYIKVLICRRVERKQPQYEQSAPRNEWDGSHSSDQPKERTMNVTSTQEHNYGLLLTELFSCYYIKACFEIT